MIHLRESIKKYKENVKMKSKTLGGWDTKVERMSEKGERMHSKWHKAKETDDPNAREKMGEKKD